MIRVLGQGSFGTVTMVRHKVTGKTYALKQILRATVIAKKQQQSVQNERSVLAKLQHPFIVNLARTFKDSKSVYMLQEVCAPFVRVCALFDLTTD